MALAPCLIGYGAIARRLYADQNTLREGNRYWQWIENYIADDYTEAVRLGSGTYLFSPLHSLGDVDAVQSTMELISYPMVELLETHMRDVSPSRMEELIQIFIRATALEVKFWDMGLGGEPV